MRHFFALLVPVVGTFAMIAEATAIDCLVIGSSAWGARLLVAIGITLGMLSIVLIVWWPWVRRWQAYFPGGLAALSWAVGGLFAVSAVVSAVVMTNGVHVAEEGDRAEDFQARLNENEAEQNAVRDRLFSVRLSELRVGQELEAAMSRCEPAGVVNSLLKESEGLQQRAAWSEQRENELILEGANIYREFGRRHQLRHLPRKTFPPPRAHRLPRVGEASRDRACRSS